MASITIRNLDDSLKSRLRMRAAGHGRPMEEDVLDILAAALDSEPKAVGNLATSIRRRFARLGGIGLPPVMRGPMPKPVFIEE